MSIATTTRPLQLSSLMLWQQSEEYLYRDSQISLICFQSLQWQMMPIIIMADVITSLTFTMTIHQWKIQKGCGDATQLQWFLAQLSSQHWFPRTWQHSGHQAKTKCYWKYWSIISCVKGLLERCEEPTILSQLCMDNNEWQCITIHNGAEDNMQQLQSPGRSPYTNTCSGLSPSRSQNLCCYIQPYWRNSCPVALYAYLPFFKGVFRNCG